MFQFQRDVTIDVFLRTLGKDKLIYWFVRIPDFFFRPGLLCLPRGFAFFDAVDKAADGVKGLRAVIEWGFVNDNGIGDGLKERFGGGIEIVEQGRTAGGGSE